MAWRRGEIWFDTDVLWFREGSRGAAVALPVPAFAFPAPEAVPVPYGLDESRRRRAELRRRRHARRTRAAALVVGPAALLTLAGPRFAGASQSGGALEEDPPTLSSRPDTRAAPPQRIGADPRAEPTRASSTKQFPAIRWRRASSHGLPYAGSLSGGTQLAIEGPDWVTWNPVTDRVPNEPRRLYGNERTIRAIVSVVSAYRAANPRAPRVVVGDLSFRGGGPMELHRSHQNGLDVDLYYPRSDGRLRAPRTAGQIDRELAQDLLDRFVAAGAQMIFVGYSTGLRGPKDVVVPYPNHDDHMHVRFRPPRPR